MTSLLFLIPGIGFAAIMGYGFLATAKTGKLLSGLVTAKTKLPKAVGKLMFFAQLTEVAHLVQHATAANMLATLVLFGIWLAINSGTEGEMY